LADLFDSARQEQKAPATDSQEAATAGPEKTAAAGARMLEIADLHVYYGNIHALKGITLHIFPGEIVTLIGANGAGKSTTLNTVSGLLRPRSGSITYEGADLTDIPAHKVVTLGLSQSPEGRKIFPRMTVRENLEMGAFSRSGQDLKQDFERVYELFPVLRERQAQRGGTLSGGEQQMLAMGRALMARPKLLMLDEPSMGLAPMLVEKIFDIIKEINAQGTTILLVEQNANVALEVSDRGYVLETGSIVLTDSAGALLENSQVREAYLGAV
jgi:branched-chain amino acid transport system ATP-binding protein